MTHRAQFFLHDCMKLVYEDISFHCGYSQQPTCAWNLGGAACLLCELVKPGLVFSPLLAVPSSRILHNSERLYPALRATLPSGTESISAAMLRCFKVAPILLQKVS